MQTEGAFTYTSWLEGLRQGRTFITNGPALWLSVDGQEPGAELAAGNRATVEVSWRSHYPLDRVEIVRDGDVVASRALQGTVEQREGTWAIDVQLDGNGWVAARTFGSARDSFKQAVYAHSSPVYVGTGLPAGKVGEAAAAFARGIESSRDVIRQYNRFTKDSQREEVLHLFEQGRKVYAALEEMG